MATFAMHSGYVGTNGPYPGSSAPLSVVSTEKGISGTNQFRSNEDPRSEGDCPVYTSTAGTLLSNSVLFLSLVVLQCQTDAHQESVRRYLCDPCDLWADLCGT